MELDKKIQQMKEEVKVNIRDLKTNHVIEVKKTINKGLNVEVLEKKLKEKEVSKAEQ